MNPKIGQLYRNTGNCYSAVIIGTKDGITILKVIFTSSCCVGDNKIIIKISDSFLSHFNIDCWVKRRKAGE